MPDGHTLSLDLPFEPSSLSSDPEKPMAAIWLEIQ